MDHKVGVICMDLSKDFDSLNHELLITKIKCYGRSYLTNRYRRWKINNNLCGLKKSIAGVPQRSILGALLFNIFLNDIFLFFIRG